MVSVAQKAKEVYEEDLRERLEAGHRDEFVAIEPVSRGFWATHSSPPRLAGGISGAKPFVIRIGHGSRISSWGKLVVIGTVDARSRCAAEVFVANRLNGDYRPVTTWIDTAFDGHLVFLLWNLSETLARVG